MIANHDTPITIHSKTERISISLPADLSAELDKMVRERGHPNRSQAVCEMIRQRLNSHLSEDENTVMAGTITIFYDSGKRGLLQMLTDLEREHVDEVISSQHVLLEGQFVMEVLLVQGPVKALRSLTNAILNCKGVQSGELTLTRKIIPPIHARGPEET
jgi:CopG family transcriptional regulator, nickel-responsive regulator